MSKRFTLAKLSDYWIVWDSEERMIVDQDEDRENLIFVVAAMNSLDRKFNHNFVQ